jgi:hypothetical protein
VSNLDDTTVTVVDVAARAVVGDPIVVAGAPSGIGFTPCGTAPPTTTTTTTAAPATTSTTVPATKPATAVAASPTFAG